MTLPIQFEYREQFGPGAITDDPYKFDLLAMYLETDLQYIETCDDKLMQIKKFEASDRSSFGGCGNAMCFEFKGDVVTVFPVGTPMEDGPDGPYRVSGNTTSLEEFKSLVTRWRQYLIDCRENPPNS